MISKLQLRNFTAFRDLSIDFSPKINIIIGENGTGKTHLLKAAYSVSSANKATKGEKEFVENDVGKALNARLVQIFMPLDQKLGKLRRHGVKENAGILALLDTDKIVDLSFYTTSKTVKLNRSDRFSEYKSESAFIPTKEVLSFMKGFTSLYRKHELSFDQTYQDICIDLDAPPVRKNSMHQKSIWAIDELSKICGGSFIFHGGGVITFRIGDLELSVNAAAEGFRKIGILSRLLETGAIEPGVSGPLFWDEPESNMNPKLLQLLVQILLELSRNGQQIIIATHDYVLLKWFDLLMDKGKDDHVRFHSLYRDSSNNEIKIASTDEYLKVSPNPIDDAFGLLINKEIENDMGDLGK